MNSMRMRDVDIRRALNYKLTQKHKSEKDTLIINELAICQGDSRIDLAVINGSFHGYEIKSESDTLERLPKQMEYYNKVFDTITILTASKFLDEIFDIIPKWWGVIQAEMDSDGQVYFYKIRKPKQNLSVDPQSIAQFLWREEAIEILKEKGLHKGFLSKPRTVLWKALAEKLPLNELSDAVRKKMVSRTNWRVN